MAGESVGHRLPAVAHRLANARGWIELAGGAQTYQGAREAIRKAKAALDLADSKIEAQERAVAFTFPKFGCDWR